MNHRFLRKDRSMTAACRQRGRSILKEKKKSSKYFKSPASSPTRARWIFGRFRPYSGIPSPRLRLARMNLYLSVFFFSMMTTGKYAAKRQGVAASAAAAFFPHSRPALSQSVYR